MAQKSTCSNRPKRKATNKYTSCTVCAGPVYRRTKGEQCSQSCYERWLRSKGTTSFAAQKVRHQSLVPPKVTLDRSLSKLGKGDRAKVIAYLLERDGYRCQIPGCVYINRRMGVGLRKPSLDHVIPLTRGGINELANIQLSHLRCNIIKNNRGVGDQLALIG